MRVTLEVIRGPETGRKLNFRADQLVNVGRTEWADIALSRDPQISGMHFSIEIERDRCQLTDLKSRNGTYVNDERVTVAELKDGDRVLVGETWLQVAVFAPPKKVPQTERHPELSQDPRDAVVEAEVETPVVVPSSMVDPGSGGPQVPPASVRKSIERKETMVGKPPSFSPYSDLPEVYSKGLTDEDPLVREAALECAVWNRQAWLLKYCRRIAATPALKNLSEFHWLANLGDASDVERILKIGRLAALGPVRFSVMGVFGHPDVVPELLIGMENDDAESADAAHKAFLKMTGQQFDSEDVALIAESDDEFEQEFADEVTLPDTAAARQYWETHKGRFAAGQRWCGGHDLSDLRRVTESQLSQLDMASIRESIARARFYGVSDATRADLDRFPFRVRLKLSEQASGGR